MSNQIYRQQIIDHYKNPRNVGKIENADYTGEKYNYSCGDEIEIFIKAKDGKVEEVKFEVRGCAISIAGASLVSQELKGMTIDEVKSLDKEFIQELMGTQFTGSRINCATLGLDSIKEAIQD